MSSIICLILLVSKYHLTTGSSIIDIDLFETHNEDSSILIPSVEESASFTNDRQINQIKTIHWEKNADSRIDTLSNKSHIRGKRMLQEGNEQEMAVLSPVISPQTKKKGYASSTPRGTTNKKKVPALKGTTTKDNVSTQSPPPRNKDLSSTDEKPAKKGNDPPLNNSVQKGGKDTNTAKDSTNKGNDSSLPQDSTKKGNTSSLPQNPTKNGNNSSPGQKGGKDTNNKDPSQNDNNISPGQKVGNNNVNDNNSSPGQKGGNNNVPPQNDSNRDDKSPTQEPIDSLIQTNPNTSATCIDSTMRFKVAFEGKTIGRYCTWVARKDTAIRCAAEGINETCPLTCGTCALCKDSPLRLKFILNDALVARSCDYTARLDTEERCTIPGMVDTCRETCGSCS